MKDIYSVIKRPLVTEKTQSLKVESDKHGKVVFEVAMGANKIDVSRAVKHLFDVKPIAVHTSIVRGKPKRVKTQVGKQSNWKKAVVTLPEGTDLDIFGIVDAPAVPED